MCRLSFAPGSCRSRRDSLVSPSPRLGGVGKSVVIMGCLLMIASWERAWAQVYVIGTIQLRHQIEECSGAIRDETIPVRDVKIEVGPALGFTRWGYTGPDGRFSVQVDYPPSLEVHLATESESALVKCQSGGVTERILVPLPKDEGQLNLGTIVVDEGWDASYPGLRPALNSLDLIRRGSEPASALGHPTGRVDVVLDGSASGVSSGQEVA
jgi:hypothetical protein